MRRSARQLDRRLEIYRANLKKPARGGAIHIERHALIARRMRPTGVAFCGRLVRGWTEARPGADLAVYCRQCVRALP